LVVNGVPKGINQDIIVTAAQLPLTKYQSGNGADQLWIRASDGAQWSPWQPFTVESAAPAIVKPGATLELGGGFSGQVTFFGTTGTLLLDNSASFAGTVAGMTGADAIDLADIDFATAQAPVFSGSAAGGTLSVSDASHIANIALLGNYLASTFVISGDGHGGTTVVDPVIGSSNPPDVTQPQH
jgi:hypothetical protein